MITKPSLIEEVDALYSLRPDAVEDPYPIYRRMQAEAPVLDHSGVIALTKYADVAAVIRNMTDYSNQRGRGSRAEAAFSKVTAVQAGRMQEVMGFLDLWITQMDPPAHTRIRGLVHRAFTPRRVGELDDSIQRLTDELIDEAAENRDFDFSVEFAYHLPLLVIAEMLGVDRSDLPMLGRWSDTLTKFFGTEYSNVDEAHDAMTEFRAYAEAMIADRRRTPHDDLLAALLEPDESGDKLSAEELCGTFVLFLRAGHSTVSNLLGNGLHSLLLHPDQLRRLVDDPSLWGSAMEEILRYAGPAHTVHRFALRTTTVNGTSIPAGMTIRTMPAAANRDPDRFEDPDRFDVGRDDARHLTFGIGPHFCLGAALARREVTIALSSLITRFPGLELAGEPRWKLNMTLRGLETLPLKLR